MNSIKNNDALTLLLQDFDSLKTWTTRKKHLKKEIKKEIDRLHLHKIVLSKSKFHLSRFGQTKIINTAELTNYLDFPLRAKKIQLICLEPDHCVFFWTALRDV